MATKKAKTDEDPIWVCVDGLIHNGALFKHGDTYLASESEDVRRDHPASFLKGPARANAAIMREALEPEPEPEPMPKRARRVRARRSMLLGDAVLPTGHVRCDAVTFINEGDEVPESHPVVRARPRDFEPVR